MLATATPIVFLALAVAVPGVALSRRVRIKSPCPAVAFFLACGLGAAMALQWCLYAFGIRTHSVQCGVFAVHAVAAIVMTLRAAMRIARSPARNRERASQFAWYASVAKERVPDIAVFAAATALGILASLAVAGAPFTHWDAVISWDKWATDAAARTGLGRHVCGGYPQGVPLLLSAALQIAGPEALEPFSTLHIVAANALHALFAFAAIFSVAALAKTYGASAAVSLAGLTLVPSIRSSLFDPAHCGLADLPVAAATLGALVVATADNASIAALAAAFFAMIFTKGNGLAYLPLLIAASAFTKGTRALRRTIPAAALALVLAIPFWIHQWWYGVHLDMPGADPLMHNMEVYAAHTRLFTPDFAHLAHTLRSACASVAPRFAGTSLGIALFSLAIVVVCVLLIIRRKTAPLAALAVSLYALWFFTASYDGRNALAANFFIVLCGGVAVVRVAARLRRSRANTFANAVPAVVAIALVCIFASGEAGREVQRGVSGLVERMHKSAQDRAAQFSDVKFFHDFWMRAPWAARAEHIIAFSRDVRLWKGKGVYAMQRPAFRDVRKDDLFFSYVIDGREIRPPEPFIPVATVANHRLGRTLFVAAPPLEQVPFTATSLSDGRSVAPGEILPAGTVVRIAVDSEKRDGVAEILFDRDLPGAMLSLASESVRRDPYAKLFRSVSDGAASRVVWWTRKAANPPVFEAALPQDAAIVGFRLAQ